VTAPQEIDPAKVDDMRAAFKRIIECGREDSSTEQVGTAEGYSAAVADHPDLPDHPDHLDFALPDGDPATPGQGDPSAGTAPSAPLRHSKTLRVDTAKVESLVNLASELIIALSAFDQNMGSMGNVIGEIDRSRQRLKGTARDLELGYEVKAIQHLGSHQTLLQSHGASTGEGTGTFSEFDLLELDRYSEFNLIIRSLNETAVDVSTISTQLSDIHRGFEAYFNRLRLLLSELQEKVMRVRMTPMTTLVNRLRRTVRETAAQLGKDVHFSIHGEEIELDKVVWEKLADPLMHLLRNAIDHGIEPLVKRRALGKPDTATVRLNAAYQGNRVVIRIMDDGAGLDFEAIRRTAASFTPASKLDRMTREDLAEMVFLPGFSTRQAVSQMSGRGVGMDVVKENIAALKGRVQVETSAEDQGTTFQIRIPLTLAVMRALLFTVAGRLYATALYDIKEIKRVNPQDISDRNGVSGRSGASIKIGERTLPFFRLSDYLAGGPAQNPSADPQTWPLVMVIDTGAWQGSVAIDQMYNQREIVIKNLGTHLRRVKGIAGATVLGDGRIAPILNLEELLTTQAAQPDKPGRPAQPVMQKPLEIMVVDDSVSVRTVVSRLMQRQGWKVQTAKDGVEAMERLHTYCPDLVVLDIEMPRMNGYEFLSAFRAQAEFKATPVVMLTSRAASKHQDKAKALGANGFMTKPYEDGDFISLVKRLTQ
jgi:chemosensory pili system protein ChpA (sensor histidine kinase/response regulator)